MLQRDIKNQKYEYQLKFTGLSNIVLHKIANRKNIKSVQKLKKA